ncbi:MAG TPA: hypothetical protein EYM84_04530 [Flavobacteriales bacterium]|nr:hypothetical protein [Flavobacteriales bacterium]HIN39520.1 hypothetical protein [Flavobacteriales bacterium]
MSNRYFIYLLLILFFLSCKKEKIDDRVTFKETVFEFRDEMEFDFPSIIGLNIPWVLPSIDISINFPQEVGYTDPLINGVENILLKSMTAEILSPSNEDFSFLKHLTIYITAPGLPDIELAHLYNISPNPGNIIDLVPAGNVLDTYVKRDDYNMKIEVTADKLMLQDVKVNASLVLEVTLINER